VSAEEILGPEALQGDHAVEGFACGVPALDDYLIKRALHDQRSDKSRTYVIARGKTVVGYFSLAAASVDPLHATARLAAGQGAQDVPAILLGRLAVDRGVQGRGFGEALLVEALARAAGAADMIGARAVLVHAASDRARSFYLRYGFEPSPTDPLHLILLMKDIRKTLRA
jgi:GNAT superfamily N-acetyltransferase